MTSWRASGPGGGGCPAVRAVPEAAGPADQVGADPRPGGPVAGPRTRRAMGRRASVGSGRSRWWWPPRGSGRPGRRGRRHSGPLGMRRRRPAVTRRRGGEGRRQALAVAVQASAGRLDRWRRRLGSAGAAAAFAGFACATSASVSAFSSALSRMSCTLRPTSPTASLTSPSCASSASCRAPPLECSSTSAAASDSLRVSSAPSRSVIMPSTLAVVSNCAFTALNGGGNHRDLLLREPAPWASSPALRAPAVRRASAGSPWPPAWASQCPPTRRGVGVGRND